MKHIHKKAIVPMLMVAGITVVSALEQTVPVQEAVRLNASARLEGGVNGGKNMNSGQVVSSMARAAMPAQRLIPTTGDAVIDAKLKVLAEDREARIDAINDEYMKKVKALIGDRTVKMYSLASSSTPRAMMVGNVQMAASGTARGLGNGGVMIRREEKAGDASANVTSRNIGAQFNALFRGMFGGDR